MDEPLTAVQAKHPRAVAAADVLIQEFEGCVLSPYRDDAGVWTIGIGTTIIDGHPVTRDTPAITRERALELLNIELAAKVAAVDYCVPMSATDNQRAACYSFAYNLGSGALRGSTLLELWKQRQTEKAALQFLEWSHYHDPLTHELRQSAGLLRRRYAEAALFMKPDDPVA